MKLSQIISIALCLIGSVILVCTVAQASGGVEPLRYLNTLGWSAIAFGGSVAAWPHGRKGGENLPSPPSLSARRGTDRKA